MGMFGSKKLSSAEARALLPTLRSIISFLQGMSTVQDSAQNQLRYRAERLRNKIQMGGSIAQQDFNDITVGLSRLKYASKNYAKSKLFYFDLKKGNK